MVCPPPRQHLVLSVCSITTFRGGMKCYLAVVLVCTSLLANDAEPLFTGLLALFVSSQEKYLIIPFAHFLIGQFDVFQRHCERDGKQVHGDGFCSISLLFPSSDFTCLWTRLTIWCHFLTPTQSVPSVNYVTLLPRTSIHRRLGRQSSSTLCGVL